MGCHSREIGPYYATAIIWFWRWIIIGESTTCGGKILFFRGLVGVTAPGSVCTFSRMYRLRILSLVAMWQVSPVRDEPLWWSGHFQT